MTEFDEYKKEEVLRLLKNVQKLINANALEAEVEAAADDAESVDILTIEDLNDYLEESMTYWEE